MSTTRPRPLRERALEKVDQRGPGECWPWLGQKDEKGYGQVRESNRRSRSLMAHRVVYELLVGLIPEGLTLDHLCRVRHCVNPAHLEPVTNRENILRGDGPAARHARQTHCKYGHPFDEQNTLHRRNGRGRSCRTCQRERSARFRARLALIRELGAVS
jgi:hypothetical protein